MNLHQPVAAFMQGHWASNGSSSTGNGMSGVLFLLAETFPPPRAMQVIRHPSGTVAHDPSAARSAAPQPSPE